jgi:hypothetical protein
MRCFRAAGAIEACLETEEKTAKRPTVELYPIGKIFEIASRQWGDFFHKKFNPSVGEPVGGA